jgi:hypothetical protein
MKGSDLPQQSRTTMTTVLICAWLVNHNDIVANEMETLNFICRRILRGVENLMLCGSLLCGVVKVTVSSL